MSLITRRKRKDFKEQVTFHDVPIHSEVLTIVLGSNITCHIVPRWGQSCATYGDSKSLTSKHTPQLLSQQHKFFYSHRMINVVTDVQIGVTGALSCP